MDVPAVIGGGSSSAAQPASGGGHDLCACGTTLVVCHKCGDSRCLVCDPYDDRDRCGSAQPAPSEPETTASVERSDEYPAREEGPHPELCVAPECIGWDEDIPCPCVTGVSGSLGAETAPAQDSMSTRLAHEAVREQRNQFAAALMDIRMGALMDWREGRIDAETAMEGVRDVIAEIPAYRLVAALPGTAGGE